MMVKGWLILGAPMAGPPHQQIGRVALQSRHVAGINRILQRLGGELVVPKDVHRLGKVRTANRVVPMAIAGRLLHAQQDQGGTLRIKAKAINTVRCGVAVPAQLVSASLVAGAELLGEAVAAEFRALRKRPVATIHKDGVEVIVSRRQSMLG
jgi:hypothetical protein